MNTSSSDTKSTKPNQHDYDELVTIYSHLDSTTTLKSFGTAVSTEAVFGTMPDALTSTDFDRPELWGDEIERSENGRTSTYMLDLGDGRKIVTYVIWADDQAVERAARDHRN